jgi:hypothetical protein
MSARLSLLITFVSLSVMFVGIPNARANGGEGGGGAPQAAASEIRIEPGDLRQRLRTMSFREARRWALELNLAHRREDTDVVFVGFSGWMTIPLTTIMRHAPDILEGVLRDLDGVSDSDERAEIIRGYLDEAEEREERVESSFDRDSDDGLLPEGSRERRAARSRLQWARVVRRHMEAWLDNPEQGFVPQSESGR